MIPIRSSQNDSELEVADSAAGQDISEYKTEEGGGRREDPGGDNSSCPPVGLYDDHCHSHSEATRSFSSQLHRNIKLNLIFLLLIIDYDEMRDW